MSRAALSKLLVHAGWIASGFVIEPEKGRYQAQLRFTSESSTLGTEQSNVYLKETKNQAVTIIFIYSAIDYNRFFSYYFI